MRYFRLSSKWFGRTLLDTRETNMRFLEIGRLTIILDFPKGAR